MRYWNSRYAVETLCLECNFVKQVGSQLRVWGCSENVSTLLEADSMKELVPI